MKKVVFALFLIIPLSVLTHFSSFAQDFKDKFAEANLLTEEGFFAVALPIWQELLAKDPDNGNLNYKVGHCYFESRKDKKNAMPYFEKAVMKASRGYDDLDPKDKKAPLDSYLYYGICLQLDNKIDEALANYNEYKTLSGVKGDKAAIVDEYIAECYTAKEFMANPAKVKIVNLGSKINSRFIEHSPVISYDEQTLFFTSRRLRPDSANENITESTTGLYYEDVYVSYKDKNGNWSDPKVLNIDRADDHEATIGLSADGSILYIYKDFNGNGNIYESRLEREGWTTPTMLGSDINLESFETHVTVSSDGNILLFVSDREGGIGGKDIWQCKRLPNGEWGLATNIGAPINTTKDEDGPYLHPDGKTLYYSSNGNKTMGGFDIFFSEKEDDGSWGKPLNMGYPINTTGDDIFYIISPDGKRAYYASAQDFGYGESDLYMIEQQEVKEKPLTLLKGYVLAYGANKELLQSATIQVRDNTTGQDVGEARPQFRNGSYVFIIPSGKDYNIAYYADGKDIYSMDVYVPENSSYQEVQKEIFLKPLKIDGDPNNVDLEVVVIKEDVFSDKLKWQLRYKDPNKSLSIGLEIDYIDSKKATTHSENISKDGYFKYYEQAQINDYAFRLLDTSYVNLNELEIVLIDRGYPTGNVFIRDNEDVFRLFIPEIIADAASIQEGLDSLAAKSGKTIAEVSSNFLKLVSKNGETLPAGLLVQIKDRAGNVISEQVVGEDGSFSYTMLNGNLEDYVFGLLNVGDNFEYENWIIVEVKDNKITDKIIAHSKNGIYGVSTETEKIDQDVLSARVSQDLMNIKSMKIQNMGNNKNFDNITVQVMNADGTVQNEDIYNNDGDFNYKKLQALKNQVFRLKQNGQTICEELEAKFEENNDGNKYILIPDENCNYSVFTIPLIKKEAHTIADNAEKIEQQNNINLKYADGTAVKNATLQITDRTTGEVTVVSMEEDEDFQYKKLLESSSKIKLITSEGEQCKDAELRITENGLPKKLYLTADENCEYSISKSVDLPKVVASNISGTTEQIPVPLNVSVFDKQGKQLDTFKGDISTFIIDDKILDNKDINIKINESTSSTFNKDLAFITNKDGEYVKHILYLDEKGNYQFNEPEIVDASGEPLLLQRYANREVVGVRYMESKQPLTTNLTITSFATDGREITTRKGNFTDYLIKSNAVEEADLFFKLFDETYQITDGVEIYTKENGKLQTYQLVPDEKGNLISRRVEQSNVVSTYFEDSRLEVPQDLKISVKDQYGTEILTDQEITLASLLSDKNFLEGNNNSIVLKHKGEKLRDNITVVVKDGDQYFGYNLLKQGDGSYKLMKEGLLDNYVGLSDMPKIIETKFTATNQNVPSPLAITEVSKTGENLTTTTSSLNKFLYQNNRLGDENLNFKISYNGVEQASPITITAFQNNEYKIYKITPSASNIYSFRSTNFVINTESITPSTVVAVAYSKNKELLPNGVTVTEYGNDGKALNTEPIPLMHYLTTIESTKQRQVPFTLEYKGTKLNEEIYVVTEKDNTYSLYSLIADLESKYEVLDQKADQATIKAEYIEQAFLLSANFASGKAVPQTLNVKSFDSNGNIASEEDMSLEQFAYQKLDAMKGQPFSLFANEKELCEKIELERAINGVTELVTLVPDDKCQYKIGSTKELIKILDVRTVAGSRILSDKIDIVQMSNDNKLQRNYSGDITGYLNNKSVLGNRDISFVMDENGKPFIESIIMASRIDGVTYLQKISPDKDGNLRFSEGKVIENYKSGLDLVAEYNKRSNQLAQTNPVKTVDPKATVNPKTTEPITTGGFGTAKSAAKSMAEIRKEKELAEQQKAYEKTVENAIAGVFRPEINYDQYYSYNKNSINPQDPAFIKFIDQTVAEVKKLGKVDVVIESSASKVPTRAYTNNLTLSKIRAENAQKLFIDEMKKRGVTEEQIVFMRINTIVSGPPYNSDSVKNKTEYYQYQYVKIIIK